MKVSELIEELRQQEQDGEVVIDTQDGFVWEVLGIEGFTDEDFSGETQVFLNVAKKPDERDEPAT